MRRKSEHVLDKMKSNNYLGFKEYLEREIISFFCQNIILSYLFMFILINRIKTQQYNDNKSCFFNKIEICHSYVSLLLNHKNFRLKV